MPARLALMSTPGEPTSFFTRARAKAGRALQRAGSRLAPPAGPPRTPVAGGAARDAAAPGSCLICHTPGLRRRTISRTAQPGQPARTRVVNVCRGCGYVAIDELTQDRYRGTTSIDEIPGGGRRAGSEERPGREFQMAKMALEMLDRKAPDVLVYGAGRSLDNHHIQRLPNVGEVAIADIMKVRDDAPFVDANDPGSRRFPIVVASEVVEHFRNPPEDFTKLFRVVGEKGLLVCGTNIRDGRPLAREPYVYYPDHTSFYTPDALLRIAGEHGFFVDFRSVHGFGGNKRYVLFTRSAEVLARVTAYFGTHLDAPSEKSMTDDEKTSKKADEPKP
jgi:SAM-dependent methyltransferase